MKLSIIVDHRNQYFSYWGSQSCLSVDGCESYHLVPCFTTYYPKARVYETEYAAQRAAKRIYNFGKLAVVTMEVEEDPDPDSWKYDYCYLHDCWFRSTELYPMCPHRNELADKPNLRPTNCIPDIITITEIMES
jgi:hypothetical protein